MRNSSLHTFQILERLQILPVFSGPRAVQPPGIQVMPEVCHLDFSGNGVFRQLPDVIHISNAFRMRQQAERADNGFRKAGARQTVE